MNASPSAGLSMLLVETEQGRVSAFSVRHILKNRTYAGVIEALKTESVEPKERKGST